MATVICLGCRRQFPRKERPWGVSLCRRCFALAVRTFLQDNWRGEEVAS